MAVNTERPPAPLPHSLDARPDTRADTSTLDTYSLVQAADLLSLSTKTLRRRIKGSKIAATKQLGDKGPEWRLDKEEVDRLAEQQGAEGTSPGIVRATVDNQLESLTVKVSSLMQEWVDTWADKTAELVQAVQAGQSAQTDALQEVGEVIREGLDQQGRIQHLEERIQQLEQPRRWWRFWQRTEGGTHNAEA